MYLSGVNQKFLVKTSLVVLGVTFVVPLMVAVLLTGRQGIVSLFLERNLHFTVHAALNTGFPFVANVYYILSIAFLPLQYVVVARHVLRVPLSDMRRLRDVYADRRPWLSVAGVTLLDNRIGTLLSCVLLTLVTVFAVFYLGPGFGGDGADTPINTVIFFGMNSLGVLSLLLYEMVFIMWFRLIYSNRDSSHG